jgi:hypothetical protein
MMSKKWAFITTRRSWHGMRTSLADGRALQISTARVLAECGGTTSNLQLQHSRPARFLSGSTYSPKKTTNWCINQFANDMSHHEMRFFLFLLSMSTFYLLPPYPKGRLTFFRIKNNLTTRRIVVMSASVMNMTGSPLVMWV